MLSRNGGGSAHHLIRSIDPLSTIHPRIFRHAAGYQRLSPEFQCLTWFLRRRLRSSSAICCAAIDVVADPRDRRPQSWGATGLECRRRHRRRRGTSVVTLSESRPISYQLSHPNRQSNALFPHEFQYVMRDTNPNWVLDVAVLATEILFSARVLSWIYSDWTRRDSIAGARQTPRDRPINT